MSDAHDIFSDPAAVARYAQGPTRIVPGYATLHRMVEILLAERAPPSARILVIGAGGGLEIRDLAVARADWTFEGVDPSAEMLDLARQTLGPLSPRVQLHRGGVETASKGPFDGATCLLTMHFLDREERRETVTEAHRRLTPGAAFVVAHLSFPQGTRERERWLSRYAAFTAASGIESAKAAAAADAISERLPVLSPDEDEAILRDGGFKNIETVYAGLAFRGWVARA